MNNPVECNFDGCKICFFIDVIKISKLNLSTCPCKTCLVRIVCEKFECKKITHYIRNMNWLGKIQ